MSSITCIPVDFSTSAIAGPYDTFFALILEDVFTASECVDLIALAESEEPWKPANAPREQPGKNRAPISGGEYAPVHAVSQAFRNSERIMRDDPVTAAKIFERIQPFLHEVAEIGPDNKFVDITGKAGQKWSAARGETGFWRLAKLNHRLRFLKYGPGQYFKPHCDGLQDVAGSDDGSEPTTKSFITIHLYLNDGNGLEGGATRFYTPNKKRWLDVEPKLGRILIFQQRMLVHSGEEVTGGTKYTLRTDIMFEKVVVTREQRKAAEAAAAQVETTE